MSLTLPEVLSSQSDSQGTPGSVTGIDQMRIGVVRYINTLPLIDGLSDLERCTLVPDVPAQLINRLTSGEVDLALCSVIDSVRSPVPVKIVPVGMLGCNGRTLTVRLYARCPWKQVRTVAADTDSHTSRALAELIFLHKFGVRPTFIDYQDAASGTDPGTDAMLLIGDKVIAHAPDESNWPQHLDLGEAWHEWTGLPFVFATWLARADSDPHTAARVMTAARVLDHQRRHNRQRINNIVAREAAQHGWPEDLAFTYLAQLLRFDFDAHARQGMNRFLLECHKVGLAPAPQSPPDFSW